MDSIGPLKGFFKLIISMLVPFVLYQKYGSDKALDEVKQA